MSNPRVAAAFFLAMAASAFGAAERPQDRWNLADLYPSVQAWSEDAARTEAELKQLASCHGHLGESAGRLRRCLDLLYGVQKRYAKVSVYAGELEAEDTGRQESQALNQKAQVIGAKINEESAFVNPEILAIGRARVAAFLRQDPGLAIYRHPIDDILRGAATMPSPFASSVYAAPRRMSSMGWRKIARPGS